MKRYLLLIVFCFVSCVIFARASFCEDEEFARAHIGFCIVDVETEKEICSLNGEQFFIPASLQKIPTSVVAISQLGEDYRFRTSLEYEGEIDKHGLLHGNLWVHGGGDPTLSMNIFSECEEALQRRGIHEVEGKIFVDVSDFETPLASPYWDFQDLGNYYGAGACALNINHNMYRITFKPGEKEGDPAVVIKRDPEIPNLIVHNEVTTGPPGSGDRVFVYGMEYSPIQFYRGTVPLDKPTFTTKASIPDPVLFCVSLLKQKTPVSQGVEIIRNKSKSPSSTILIGEKRSPPLKELIALMNRYSINLYAEHLLKAIGSGSSQKGAATIEEFLKKLDIPSRVRDGAGLARSNYLTPRGFTRLLCHIRKSPLYQPVYASLPKPGEKGTLEGFPKIAGATLRAKTGSLTHVYNLGGYLTLDSGKEYAFCLFCNHYTHERRNILDEMHRYLTHFVQSHPP